MRSKRNAKRNARPKRSARLPGPRESGRQRKERTWSGQIPELWPMRKRDLLEAFKLRKFLYRKWTFRRWPVRVVGDQCRGMWTIPDPWQRRILGLQRKRDLRLLRQP